MQPVSSHCYSPELPVEPCCCVLILPADPHLPNGTLFFERDAKHNVTVRNYTSQNIGVSPALATVV